MKNFFIKGPAGQLETILTEGSTEVAIVCHPHPLFEGTMHNKVVTTVARFFENKGYSVLRFNFRGVGKSEGQYGEMKGEIDDLLAVIEWVENNFSNFSLSLAGFSFGSYIAAAAANKIPAKQLISIAPPVESMDFKSLNQINCPWLVVQGDQDEIVSFEKVLAFAKEPPAPLKLEVVKDCGHFFHGRLIELKTILEKNCV